MIRQTVVRHVHVFHWPPAATACNTDQSQSYPRTTISTLTLTSSAYNGFTAYNASMVLHLLFISMV